MSSIKRLKRQNDEHIIELTPRDELLRICKRFDNENEKVRHFLFFKEFCTILSENEEINERERILEDEMVEEVITAALLMQNYFYKIKLLKVLLVYWNKSQIYEIENYEKIKDEILNLIPNETSTSIFKMPESFITSNCNRKFFELIFLLKETRLQKFEFEFEEFIKLHKKLYGEYWKTAMKSDTRYLLLTIEGRNHYKTSEFIFQKCTFLNLNSKLLTEFEELSELCTIFGNTLSKTDEKFLKFWNTGLDNFDSPDDEVERNEFQEFFSKNFKKTDQNRKLLFGRKTENDLSLLEKILSNPNTSIIIHCLWKQFGLWKKPELINFRNPMGKMLLDYALSSESYELIGALMMPQIDNEETFLRRKFFMVQQNNQFYSITGKCLIECLLENLVIEEDGTLFPHFRYMLEEIGVIEELQRDELIERLIELAGSEDFYEQIAGLPSDFYNNDMSNKRMLFHIDDILGNMIAYWSPKGDVYEDYKKKLINISPFYKLMFLIVEKKSSEFCKEFHEIAVDIEKSYRIRYHDFKETDTRLHYSQNLMFIMLIAAIKTNQRKVIDFIFSYETFITIAFAFPENMVTQEIHYYTALKFLHHKHEIGSCNVPKEWFTREVLEEFFDSQIKFYNQELLEIDCQCMLHAETKKISVKSVKDVTDKVIMWDDTTSLEFLKNNENLKPLLSHPVIETFIKLKSLKYERIFDWNFWTFVILFILPFTLLIKHNHYEWDIGAAENSSIIYFIMRFSHIIGLIYIIGRELFQYLIDDYKTYFKKSSNYLDLTLTIISITLSVSILFGQKRFVTSLEVAFILFTTISATSILPFDHVPNNMQILKKVAMTFLRIFYTFAIILIAFSFSFCIMFENELKENQKSSDENNSEDDEKKPLKNFNNPFYSFVKLITMLSGEYEIQPFILSAHQLLFYAIFVISSFILFNLILGLSIEDVQELKKSSRHFDLITKTCRFIEVSNQSTKYYKGHHADHQKSLYEYEDSSFFRELSFKVIRFFLSKYIYLHTFQKILVNLNTKQVFILVDRNQEPILKTSSNTWNIFGTRNHRISKETFKDIQEIIHENNRKTFKHLKKKIGMEAKMYEN